MRIELSTRALDRIASQAAVPNYDRAQLTAGILHFGIGNFHRAHQAVYLDALFNQGRDHDWAIVGAGVLPSDEKMRQLLARQDNLTTVVEQDADRSTARVTGAMIDYLEPGDTAATIAKLADPAIRIVSLTITEGGYFIDASGRFDPAHPDIAADGAAPEDPVTVFGLIAAGLKRRRAAGIPPFTVMSCDNIPHNGVVTRNAVVGLAALFDPELAAWIGENVAFPNGMVDRITPATSDRERQICAADYGIEDACPVFCEGFKQWVLEDDFPAGRPALEEVGVQFVPDVTPYEHMKIRILNGGHAAIAYPAGLLDIHYVHEAMENPFVRAFLEKIEYEEIIPVVPPVPDMDLLEYFRLIEERFSNPKIGDTVRRLCFDGSNRQPKFIVPSIAERLAQNAGIDGLALESALWCRYCYGVSERGKIVEPNDPAWERLQAQAHKAKEDPQAWLGMEDIYGEVARSEIFRTAFTRALSALWEHGTEKVLTRYLEGRL
ncbi:mannitol dehydrogenase family protein [Chelativorans sp. YIM 93263]|uniref:mannitol dehydrogenase family protein n=1 Tax=Chelativorans sp. YIM 93263 TaxID=2906648 RepID=UPI002377DE66|nr:mannitol dehydrogenase family protein [Chelativorans sp. YIM 93263]